MIKPMKTCKNPECKEEFNDYKSAKREYCCTTCTQRAGFLKRKAASKDILALQREYKKQYELLSFISEYAKNPIRADLLDQFKINYNLYKKTKSENKSPIYHLKNFNINIDPNNSDYIVITKTILTAKPTS